MRAFSKIVRRAPFSRSLSSAQISTLGNGLRVASEKVAGDHAVIALTIDAGSRYEDARTNGTSNLLTRLIQNSPQRQEIASLGGEFGAATTRERTTIFARVPPTAVPEAVKAIAGAVLNVKIDAESVNAEKKHVLEELENPGACLETYCWNRLHETAFRGTALARPTLGTTESVTHITEKDVADYKAALFTAPRAVLVGTGAVDSAELARLGEAHFSALPQSGPEVFKQQAFFTGSDLRVRHDGFPFAHVAMAFPTGTATDPQNVPLLLMQYILGAWQRPKSEEESEEVKTPTKLISEFVKNEIGENLQPFFVQYSDVGLFGVYTVMEPEGQELFFDNLLPAALHNLAIFGSDLDQTRLARAKLAFRTNVETNLTDAATVSEEIGRQVLLLGKRIPPSELLHQVEKLTVKDIRHTAERLLYDRDFALSAVGPIYELPDYNRLRDATWTPLI